MKWYLLFTLIILNYFKVEGQDKIDFFEFSSSNLEKNNANNENISFNGYKYFAIKTTDLAMPFPNNINQESYLGDGIFLASCTDETFKTLTINKEFKIGRISYLSKINQYLNTENEINIFNLNHLEKTNVLVSFIGNFDETFIQKYMQENGFEVSAFSIGFKRFTVNATKAQIDELALIPFVRYISPQLSRPTPLLGSGIAHHRVNWVQSNLFGGFGLMGKGINVGEWDESTVGPHIDFEQRVINIDKKELDISTNTHATGVAGMINGGGVISEYTKGMAPKSTLFSFDFNGDILAELQDGISKYNLSVTNHSYQLGIFSVPYNCSEPPGLYVTETSDLDKIAHDNEYVTHVFAVGNSFTGCGIGGSVVPGFQGAKNIIDVGLVDAVDVHITSSVGPTYDGRLKPEIVALGYSVFGLRRYSIYTKYFGSSFAAPMITGIIALMQEQYKKDHSGELPKSSLVKAILCNTAFDLGFTGPDYRYGYGRVNAYKALTVLSNNNYGMGIIAHGNTNSLPLNIPAGTKRLKVLIAWNEVTTTLPAAKILVNDLDLEIVDPNGQIVLPWVLGKLHDDIATRGRDSLNNIEQITIDNPIAGNYTIRIKGTSVPFGPQEYAITQSVEAADIEISNPMPGEAVAYNALGSSLFIRFEAVGTGNLSIEYSKDNGNIWTLLASNIPPTQSYLPWAIDPSLTDSAMIRISDGTTTVIRSFRVVKLPTGLTASACDKTITLTWEDEPNAIFKILMYKDTGYVQIGNTDTNFYKVSNLENGVTNLFAIIAVINGKEGPRSDAIYGTAIPGVCPIGNDAGVVELIAPFGGRKLTSSALTTNTSCSAKIKNYGNTPISNIPVKLSINGIVLNANITETIAPDSFKIVNFIGTVDLSNIGAYPYVLTTDLSMDGNRSNDTLKGQVFQLENLAVELPYLEDFEDFPKVGLSSNNFNLLNHEEWDYTTDNNGARLRFAESEFFASTGTKAATMDNGISTKPSEQNLILNLNLRNYIDSLIYIDFSALSHNELTALDFIYARGKDTDPWITILDLFTNKGIKGIYKNYKGINLSKSIILDNASDFSSSAQIRFSFNTLKKAIVTNKDGGYSIDNIALYNAGRDIAITSLPINKFICAGSSSNFSIQIEGKNNDIYPHQNIPIHYQINNGAIVSEIISNTINPQETFNYNFTQTADLNLPDIYSIKIWTNQAGDLAAFNDTVIYTINVLNSINQFPYIENFETNNGNLIAEAGTNTNWEWGTPKKKKMVSAAQGNKAWVTDLNEKYAVNQETKLYLGCFNFDALNQPIINFNCFQNIETGEIGQGLYDYTVAEYSLDGQNWDRLGGSKTGYNWYENIQDSAVWDLDSLPWQVVSQKIDLSGISDKSKYMIRLTLISDGFETREGFGIDDLHITEFTDSILGKDSTIVTLISNTNQLLDFTKNGKWIASVFNNGQTVGNISLGVFANENNDISVLKDRRILPRKFSLTTQNTLSDTLNIRLYFTNEEYRALTLKDDSIGRIGDLTIMTYNGINVDLNSDNNAYSGYATKGENEVEIVPYLDGYYIEFETNTNGEFYIVGSKIDDKIKDSTQIISFDAYKNTNNQSQLNWTSAKENGVSKYIVFYSTDGINFIPFDSTLAINTGNTNTLYGAIDSVSDRMDKIMYYTLWYRNTNDSLVYVGLDTVNYTITTIKEHLLTKMEWKGWQLMATEIQPFEATILLYDVSGKLLNSTIQTIHSGTNDFSFLNQKGLSNGSYFLHLEKSKNEYIVGKVIVVK